MYENELICGEAMDTLIELPDNSIDMIFTDPPYNSTSLNMDKIGFNLSVHLPELKRVLKDNGWFFCCGNLDMYCDIKSAGWRKKFEYIWLKSNSPMKHNTTIHPYIKHDYVFAFIKPELDIMSELYFDSIALRTKGEAYSKNRYPSLTEYNKSHGYSSKKNQTINTGYREGNTVLEYTTKTHWKDKNDHPTQKPTAMMEYIIKGYCPKGGMVLDCFMGSGTTCVAANKTDRKYIGVEINSEYYSIAKNRFASMITSFVEEDCNA